MIRSCNPHENIRIVDLCTKVSPPKIGTTSSVVESKRFHRRLRSGQTWSWHGQTGNKTLLTHSNYNSLQNVTTRLIKRCPCPFQPPFRRTPSARVPSYPALSVSEPSICCWWSRSDSSLHDCAMTTQPRGESAARVRESCSVASAATTRNPETMVACRLSLASRPGRNDWDHLLVCVTFCRLWDPRKCQKVPTTFWNHTPSCLVCGPYRACWNYIPVCRVCGPCRACWNHTPSCPV